MVGSADIRVYLDMEYCYPGMSETSGRPTSSDQRQVVQIAAIQFDNTHNKEITHFNSLARPMMDPVPPFFEVLTGINQMQISKYARSFEEVLNDFVAFAGDCPIWIFEKDQEVLEQNCGYYGVDFPFKLPFTQVKPMLERWGIDASKVSSGTLYKEVGLDMQGHVHDALHDVRSMAAAVHVLEQSKL